MTTKIRTKYLGVKIHCVDFIDFVRQMKAHFGHPYDVDWPTQETNKTIIAAKQLVNHMLTADKLLEYWHSR